MLVKVRVGPEPFCTMWSVVFYLLSHGSLLLPGIRTIRRKDVTTGRFLCATRTILVLRSGFVDRAASAAAAAANVQRNFIPEFHRLEVAVVVQALSAIPCAISIGNVIALRLADLTNSAWACAARTSAGRHGLLGVWATAVATPTRSFHCHFSLLC